MRFVILTLALVLAPASAHAAEPPAHRTRGDLAIRARDIFQRYCSECHTGGDAPGLSKLKLLEHTKVTGKKTPVPLVAASGRSQLIELVKDGSMPPANRPGPNADEIVTLVKWVKAGAPAYPVAFDERYTLAALADDFERQLANNKDAGEHIRYVSFAHLIRDGHPPPDLAAAELALAKALSSVASRDAAMKVLGKFPPPEPVDAAATLFRVDTRNLGWQARDLFERREKGKPAGAVRLQPFDLILLEYPHAQELPPNDPLRKRLDKLLMRTSQLRPVPFVRGDWLGTALDTTPLARDIQALVNRQSEFAPQKVGPPATPFAGAKSVAVPAAGEGRVPVPPLSAWYAGDVAPAKPPFAVKAELVVQGKAVTGVKVDEPFRLHVTCDRDAYFTLLMVQPDGDIVAQEVADGSRLLAGKERQLTPDGKSFVISSITSGADSATEHFVLFVSEADLPVPTILRSYHDDKYVYRFLMEPTEKDKFEPNSVVRKVIPIKVTKK